MRRAISAGITAALGWRTALAAKPEDSSLVEKAAATPQESSVQPRHVLCFLGKDANQAALLEAASRAIRDVAPGFSVDTIYSSAEPDDRMERSFAVSRDRVEPHAWTTADEKAVATHQSVLYVLGPPMARHEAVKVSMDALQLVGRLVDAGAVAIKGESAGIAHGIARWKKLVRQGAEAIKSGDLLEQQRVGRLAFVKRPLSDGGYLESVGFHLVGLPEVYVPASVGSEMQAVVLMDTVADQIARRGLTQVLKERRGTIAFESTYSEDYFKYNPYGIVKLAQ